MSIRKLLNKIFNNWIMFPADRPDKKGWYYCAICYPFTESSKGETLYATYGMDLFWDGCNFVDNRRLSVFDSYKVLNESVDLISDELCVRTKHVVAFKRLDCPYKVKGIKYYD